MSLKQNVENGELRNMSVPRGSNINVAGRFELGYETRTGAGAIDPNVPLTYVVTTGADALTLADGSVVGQVKIITLKTDGGDGTLTPANFKNGTTITFADAGDTVILQWDGTEWAMVATGYGAPVVA